MLFPELSDRNTIIKKKRNAVFKTYDQLCKKPAFYLNTRKAQVTQIFKLTQFHVSVIFQIPRIHWIPVNFCFHLGKTPLWLSFRSSVVLGNEQVYFSLLFHFDLLINE